MQISYLTDDISLAFKLWDGSFQAHAQKLSRHELKELLATCKEPVKPAFKSSLLADKVGKDLTRRSFMASRERISVKRGEKFLVAFWDGEPIDDRSGRLPSGTVDYYLVSYL